jgi:bacteriophage N4 adsorption protein B
MALSMLVKLFSFLTTIVAVGFLISGMDDLFIDIYYWCRELYRAVFKRHKIRPLTIQDLNRAPEKWTAVFVPAWQEHAVIKDMLRNALEIFDYENYDFFVGTYPNDEDTRLSVAQACEQDPRINVIVCPHDGPTCKADCLNWVYQGMLLKEREKGIKYEIIVLHDSEDIVHPLELKLFNHLIPRKDMVQLPVIPLEMPVTDVTAGTYLDEFAENHSKDLLVRERLSKMIPSAGVGTAINRTAIDQLAERKNNEPFNVSTVTEDYELGFRLAELKKTSIMAKFKVRRSQTVLRGFWRKRKEVIEIEELVAVREFFPDRFRLAVKQKSRWVLGIALQGWKQIGWPDGLSRKYMAYRDRKALFTNLFNMLGYLVLAFWIVMKFASPRGSVVLLQSRWVWYAIVADTGLMVQRSVQRFIALITISNVKQALLSVPRLLVLNVINFFATVVAAKQFLVAERTGKKIAWDKTSHAFPSAEQLQQYRRRFGDLVLENRMVSVAQLREALAEQRARGGKLGSILARMGYLQESDLLDVLSRQLKIRSCKIDLRTIDPKVVRKFPRELAELYEALPLHESDGHTVVAAADPASDAARRALEQYLGNSVQMVLAGESDIRAAIPEAYTFAESDNFDGGGEPDVWPDLLPIDSLDAPPGATELTDETPAA